MIEKCLLNNIFKMSLIFVFVAIQREEEKTKRALKDSAKKGEKEACVILAKELIHSKKAISKLYAAKAELNSVQMSMKHQLCMYTFILFHIFYFATNYFKTVKAGRFKKILI